MNAACRLCGAACDGQAVIPDGGDELASFPGKADSIFLLIEDGARRIPSSLAARCASCVLTGRDYDLRVVEEPYKGPF